MASKLVPLTKLNRILFITKPKCPTISRPAYSSASSNNHEAQDDDAMTQGVDTQGESSDPKRDNNIIPTKEDDHYIRPKTTQSNMSSSKLQSTGVNTPIDPHVQQRRTLATNPKTDLTCTTLDVKPHTLGVDTLVDPYIQQRRTLATNPKADLTCVMLETKLQSLGVDKHVDPYIQKRRTLATLASNAKADLTCAGLDGSPWPEDETASREEQEEDDKEYFKEHKASPLSKMEIGDTRKPLEKVAHGTADGYFGSEKVITWLPEQLDTAEESLLRAMKMFREAAARGVPEWPHSRRLRELRGEDW